MKNEEQCENPPPLQDSVPGVPLEQGTLAFYINSEWYTFGLKYPYAKDGAVWMNQNQLAELFATSKQNIGQHIFSILKDNELESNSVVKNFFTTATVGKEYMVTPNKPI